MKMNVWQRHNNRIKVAQQLNEIFFSVNYVFAFGEYAKLLNHFPFCSQVFLKLFKSPTTLLQVIQWIRLQHRQMMVQNFCPGEASSKVCGNLRFTKHLTKFALRILCVLLVVSFHSFCRGVWWWNIISTLKNNTSKIKYTCIPFSLIEVWQIIL